MKNSKKKINKKMLIGLVVILMVIILIIILVNTSKNNEEKDIGPSNIDTYERYVQIMQDGSKINVSEELLKTKIYNGLEITNISLKTIDGITTFVANVTNKTGKTKQEEKITVELLTKEGKQIAALKGIIDKTSPNETVKLNITVTKDVSNAYNFKITKR